MMPVQRTDDRTWIEGVKGFDPGEYASSVHGCQARILQTLGESLTYEDLICYCGFAFRVEAHEQMCPSAGHPCCGFECMANGVRALPWMTKSFASFPWDAPMGDREAFEAEARAAICSSIDRGLPVHYSGEEDGLIIGYGDDGRRWWCMHPYHKRGREEFWHDEVEGFAGGKWPWVISVWTEPKSGEERVSERELTEAALKQAVEMWGAEKRDVYFVGEAAYAHWLAWLNDVESGKADNPKGGMQGNGWYFDVLIHSRRIAARWLGQKANALGGRAATQLRSAADHYAQIGELCMRDLNSPWDLAPGPNRFDEWTGEMRRDQIARLEAAREHDRAAIETIRSARESLD